jgi:PASTA domain/Divergent InlB B-repeat domain
MMPRMGFRAERKRVIAAFVGVIVVTAAALQTGLAGASHVAPFVGTWVNDNPATLEQTRAVVAANGANLQIWGYGACHPTDCDWASSAGGPLVTPQSDASDGKLSVMWTFSFMTRTQDLTLLPDGRLHITSFSHFTDGSGRPDRTSNEDFHRTTPALAFHTLGIQVTGSGKVTSAPEGLDCPAACSLEFQGDTSVVLTAQPTQGWKLSAWQGACSGKSATCTVRVGRDETATAVFQPIPRCVVPALKRKTLAGARRSLTAAHCKLGIVRRAYSKRVRLGRIVGQSPGAGARLPNGGRVSVVVSRGMPG